MLSNQPLPTAWANILFFLDLMRTTDYSLLATQRRRPKARANNVSLIRSHEEPWSTALVMVKRKRRWGKKTSRTHSRATEKHWKGTQSGETSEQRTGKGTEVEKIKQEVDNGEGERLASIQRQQQRQRNGTSTNMSNLSSLSLPAKKLVHKAQGTP